MKPLCFETNMNRTDAFTNAIISPDGNIVLGGTEDGKIISMELSGLTIKVSSCLIIAACCK